MKTIENFIEKLKREHAQYLYRKAEDRHFDKFWERIEVAFKEYFADKDFSTKEDE